MLIPRPISILRYGDEERKIEIGTVIFAVGAEPNDGLYKKFVSSGLRVVKAGDCIKPRGILEATQEGFQAGKTI